MDFLTKIENKIGWHGVAHLPVYIVTAQAILYFWCLLNPGQQHLLMLDPSAVIEGREWWRVLTFLFITPVQNVLFAFFFLYLQWAYGMALENEWGTFPFTLFYLTGAIGTMIAGMFFGSADGAFFLNSTIFLAFAAIHPNFELLFFFVLPLKIKWLAWFTWAYFGYLLLVSPSWSKAGIAISLVNYVLFFGARHWKELVANIDMVRHRRRFKDIDFR
jgi:hypothetical protein